MRGFYFFIGLFIFIGVVATAKNNIYEYLAQTDGEIVIVKLTKVPTEKGSRKTWVDFEYKGKSYSTTHIPWSDVQRYNEGDHIPFKTYKDSEKFVPIGYSAKGELIAWIFAFILSIFCLYKCFKKE